MQLKNRGNERRKVLIYGEDGSGKSTYAEEYCLKHGLTALVIDIDDTNYTNLDIVDIDLSNDIKAYNNIKTIIKEAINSDYDTIILDGVSSLLELLTSKSPGLKAYKDRADRWNAILQSLTNSDKNLIFVGQMDMQVIYTEDHQSNKAIIKVNSIVNEKYLTLKKGDKFSTEVKKYRGSRDERPVKPKTVPKKQESLADIPNDEISASQAEKLRALPKINQAINKLKTDGELVNRENIIGALETQKGNNDTIIQKLTERMDNILRG